MIANGANGIPDCAAKLAAIRSKSQSSDSNFRRYTSIEIERMVSESDFKTLLVVTPS